MEKIVFKQAYKAYYSPRKNIPEIITIPAHKYAMVEGQGDPEGAAFRQCVEALYSISYTIRFARKKLGKEPDYDVGPLEALWWTDSGTFSAQNRSTWHWTAMILQPDFITNEEFSCRLAELLYRKPNPMLCKVVLETFQEGPVVQTMYIGPYNAEATTIAMLQAAARENGYEPTGKHHEIYLSDPRRTAPEKLRTILRQPIKKS